MDLANAKWMSDVLMREYPGIPWRCVHDGAQKMAFFSIPLLMGINKFWAVNLIINRAIITDRKIIGLLKT